MEPSRIFWSPVTLLNFMYYIYCYIVSWWQELAADDGDGKNWWGIIISILVILGIFGLVLIAIVIVSPS